MTAHPIELIAGLDDGIDLDQKDQVTRHVAACDRCRTTARTMQRIDGLIALPEPMLPLPARAMPRESVGLPRWASFATVAVTLAVTIAVTVGSLRQTQVSTSDTCDVLTAAAHSTGIRPASEKAAPIPGAGLPSRLSGSWTACGLGYIPSGPFLLLFRSRPTAGWEVRGLLVDVTSADRAINPLGQEYARKQLVFGKFTPLVGDTSSERWITEEGSQPGNGQATAVLAEPYFFVVIAPSGAAAGLLADAIVAELRQRPWPPLSEASRLDACNVITRVVRSGGSAASSATPLTTHRHWMDSDVSLVTWPNMVTNVCGIESDAAGAGPRLPIDGFLNPHLILREEPTTLQQANGLLAPLSFPLGQRGVLRVLNVYGWVQIEPGMWLTHAEDSSWSAVAVSNDPYFFAVTEANDEAAIRLARAVLAELRRP